MKLRIWLRDAEGINEAIGRAMNQYRKEATLSTAEAIDELDTAFGTFVRCGSTVELELDTSTGEVRVVDPGPSCDHSIAVAEEQAPNRDDPDGDEECPGCGDEFCPNRLDPEQAEFLKAAEAEVEQLLQTGRQGPLISAVVTAIDQASERAKQAPPSGDEEVVEAVDMADAVRRLQTNRVRH